MNTENKISIYTLIYSLLFLAFGIVLLTSTEDLISIASKVLGIGIIVTGIVNVLLYVYRKGKLGDYSIYKLIIGLLLIGLGLLLVLVSSTLSFAIRTIVGLWIVFSGINRIIFSLSIKSVDSRGFLVYLLTSFLMILLGILIISGILDKFIGLLIIIYSIMEIVDYVYYKVKNKNYESSIVPVKESIAKKKGKKGKVVDAVIY